MNELKKIITEDKIVEVLKKNIVQVYITSTNEPVYTQEDYERIANEILEGQEWEVVADGLIENGALFYPNAGRIELSDIMPDKFEGKNIEIAVREIK